ncbi:MAG: hypothetical protein CMM90_00250 [Rickettsiales bacterium]|nr:hypothetical protein [Rickettsiales bacterium]
MKVISATNFSSLLILNSRDSIVFFIGDTSSLPFSGILEKITPMTEKNLDFPIYPFHFNRV